MAAFIQKFTRKESDLRRGANSPRLIGESGKPEIVALSDWINVDATQIGAATSQWIVTYGDGSQIQIMNGLFTRCFEV